MTQITQILNIPIWGAYYNDDLAALQAKPMSESERYNAAPVTDGFDSVREPAQALAVGLVLDNGMIAWGDCVAVEFSGAAGRDPLFRSQQAWEIVNNVVSSHLIGETLTDFRSAAQGIDALLDFVQGLVR